MSIDAPCYFGRSRAFQLLLLQQSVNITWDGDVVRSRVRAKSDEPIDVVEPALGLRRARSAARSLDVLLKVEVGPMEAGCEWIDHRCVLPGVEHVLRVHRRIALVDEANEPLIVERRVITQATP